MSYQALVEAAAQVPDVDVDELLDPTHDAKAKAIFNACRPALCEARLAIASRPSVPTEPSYDYFSKHTSDLQSLRQLSRALVVAGVLAARDGDVSEAMAYFLDIVHLAHCQQRKGLIVDLLIATALNATGIEKLVALRSRLGPNQHALLIRQLIESEADCEPVTTILARDALWTITVEQPPDSALNEAELRASLSAEFSEKDIDEFVNLQRALANAPPSSNQQHIFDASDRSLAYQRLLVIELAISNYRAVHGNLPPDLETLVPMFLPTRLPDPFTNADFIYRIEDEQHLLYSVGPKRYDMGGVRGGWVEVSLGSADMFLE